MTLSSKKHNSDHLSGWDTLAKPRIESRREYGAGPASGQGIIAMYREIITRVIDERGGTLAKAMVLGATPEIRDIVLGTGVSLVSIDIHEQILHDMGELMEYKNHPNENLVIGNWLELPFDDERFDFILGDGITNNVFVNEHNKLFSEINRVLKPAGYVLLRDVVRQESHPRRQIKKIIEVAHNERWHKYDLWMELYCYNSDCGYNREGQFVDMNEIAGKFEKEFYGRGIFTDEEEQYIKKFMNGTVKSTFVEEVEWTKRFSEYFELVSVDHPDDFKYCESFKFFLGKKKRHS